MANTNTHRISKHDSPHSFLIWHGVAKVTHGIVCDTTDVAMFTKMLT